MDAAILVPSAEIVAQAVPQGTAGGKNSATGSGKTGSKFIDTLNAVADKPVVDNTSETSVTETQGMPIMPIIPQMFLVVSTEKPVLKPEDNAGISVDKVGSAITVDTKQQTLVSSLGNISDTNKTSLIDLSTVQNQTLVEVKNQTLPEVKNQPVVEVKNQPVVEVKSQPVVEVKSQTLPEVKNQPVVEVKSQADINTFVAKTPVENKASVTLSALNPQSADNLKNNTVLVNFEPTAVRVANQQANPTAQLTPEFQEQANDAKLIPVDGKQSITIQNDKATTSVAQVIQVEPEKVVAIVPALKNPQMADKSLSDHPAIQQQELPQITPVVKATEKQDGTLQETKQQPGSIVSETVDIKTGIPPVFSELLNQHTVKTSQQAAPSAPTQQPVQDPYNVVNQIVEQAQLIKGAAQNSEMIIKLKPEHLGELTLKVSVDNGVVNTSFHSNNAEVRGIIEASLAQLKQDMANTGLKVNYVGVYAGMGDSLFDGQQRGNQKYPVFKNSSRKDTHELFEPVELVAKTTSIASDSGVDYRI